MLFSVAACDIALQWRRTLCSRSQNIRQLHAEADCCFVQAWTFSNPLGNPASLYPAEVRALFDASFRADLLVQSSILGFDNSGNSFLKDQVILLFAWCVKHLRDTCVSARRCLWQPLLMPPNWRPLVCAAEVCSF